MECPTKRPGGILERVRLTNTPYPIKWSSSNEVTRVHQCNCDSKQNYTYSFEIGPSLVTETYCRTKIDILQNNLEHAIITSKHPLVYNPTKEFLINKGIKQFDIKNTKKCTYLSLLFI